MPTHTIRTTAPQEQRLAASVGHHKRLGRSATEQEVDDFLRDLVRGVVQDYERQQAVAAVPAPAAFDPT